jgi:N-acetylneuraminate synthase/N,N'-diacetyllegionaminate synthase
MVNNKMKTIKILNKFVGEQQPIFIIAEAGVNHNGKIEFAKKLVDIAANSGADAVKFQTFKTENLVTYNLESADYVKKNIGKNIKQHDMIKSLELNYQDFTNLKNYCDKKKIIFLSTPHSFDAIDYLENLVPAYKFGSGDLTNIPALKYAAKKGKPIILSTGMSTLNEVKVAIESIRSNGNDKIIALHCTTNYPCPIDEVNLRAMITMKNQLDCFVGFSDHTMGITASIAATSLGAVLIEKHFTIDRNLPGPDHKASLEPIELKNMVTEIKNIEKILGDYEKKPTLNEEKIISIVRKSIVAKNGIEKGSIIREDMLVIKRPGTGLEPNYIHKIIGKKTKRKIQRDEVFQLDMVE